MQLNGYEVEFLPLERRLQQRRSQTLGLHPGSAERRVRERRAIGADDATPVLFSEHLDTRRAA